MKKIKSEAYAEEIVNRVKEVMISAGLEIAGFARICKLSESHVYSLLSGRRPLTEAIALQIGEHIGFNGATLFNLQEKIPSNLKSKELLKSFHKAEKNNVHYFVNSKIDRKPSYFIEFEIVNSEFLSEPKYVWEINQYCKKLGKSYNSDKLKKYLKYFAIQKKLKSEKRQIKLRSGKFGKRMVDVFWR